MAQAVLVGVLLLVAAVFLLGKMGGGSEEEGEEAASPSAAATSAVAEVEAEAGAATALPTLPAPGTGPGALPPPPRPVVTAFQANQTVVLLFVRAGGIDDRLTLDSVKRLEGMAGVTPFVVPSDRIADYVSLAQGVKVNRLPALVVLRPRHLDNGVPTASVLYGFQSPESVVQAVIDAGYRGPTLSYHP